MGLKYIYAGYSKCATKTMAEAFRVLGFIVHDFEETILDDMDLWLKFYDEETSDSERKQILYDMYKNVDVVTDAPAFFFWKELMEIFPDAKCIFFEREEESWFESYRNQMEKICARKNLPDPLHYLMLRILSPTMYKYTKWAHSDLMGHFISKQFVSRKWNMSKGTINKMIACKNYRMHCADFLRNCPAEKRLILESMNCGWQVICDYVGKEIPDLRWPHKNKNGSINKELFMNPEARMVKALKKEGRDRMKLVGFVLGVFGVGIYCWKKEDRVQDLVEKLVSGVQRLV